jgi:glycerol uptake facilitator-like aquaporin
VPVAVLLLTDLMFNSPPTEYVIEHLTRDRECVLWYHRLTHARSTSMLVLHVLVAPIGWSLMPVLAFSLNSWRSWGPWPCKQAPFCQPSGWYLLPSPRSTWSYSEWAWFGGFL